MQPFANPIARGDCAAWSTDLRNLSTPELITHVIAPHHRSLRHDLPILRGLAQDVAREHGAQQPSLHEVARVVEQLAQSLLAYADDERATLLPKLLSREPWGARSTAALASMAAEHHEVATMLWVLRGLADDYACPTWAGAGYRTLMAQLAQLEADELRHVQIEKYVLVPRFVVEP
jgi:regulator of cell morphogenesis and NO signaling